MSDQNISEEMIAALIDGELTREDIAKVKQALLRDPEARATYDSLLKTKQLFANALDQLKQDEVTQQLEDMVRTYPTKKTRAGVQWKLPMSMAASVVLGAGLTFVVMDRVYMQSDLYAAKPEVDSQNIVRMNAPKIVVPVAGKPSETDISDDQKQRIKAALAVSAWPISETENQRLPIAAERFSDALTSLLSSSSSDLSEAIKLLEEAESLGHLGASIALAELTGDRAALAKYREIFSEKK